MALFLALAAIRYAECDHDSFWKKLRYAFTFQLPAPDLEFIFDANSSITTKYKMASRILLSNQFKNSPSGRYINDILGEFLPIFGLTI
jgi:hypothetical protein